MASFNSTPGQDFSRFDTIAIHSGYDPDVWHGRPVVMPITLASTFKQAEPGSFVYEYGRCDNPSRQNLEQRLAALEGGRYALTFASGIAAASAAMQLLRSGDHFVCMTTDCYSGTQRLIDGLNRSNSAIETTCCNLSNSSVDESLQNCLRPTTRMVWVETPTNPTIEIIDIAAVVRFVRQFKSNEQQIVVVVDNTFASPYFQRPLQLGADISLESLTKYINGHSDVVMGSLAMNSRQLYDRLYYVQETHGGVPSPFDCYLVWRGTQTLSLRMDRHMANGLAVAKFLESHPTVERVMHPGLPSHPQHQIAKRQMRGYSGTFSFYMLGGYDACKALMSSVRVFTCGVSLGGTHSLIEHPASMTHSARHMPLTATAAVSSSSSSSKITDGFIRISVGLEDIDDLIDDLKQALERTA